MRLNLASGEMRRGDDEIMRGLCLLVEVVGPAEDEKDVPFPPYAGS
jgi:hypothetical protein